MAMTFTVPSTASTLTPRITMNFSGWIPTAGIANGASAWAQVKSSNATHYTWDDNCTACDSWPKYEVKVWTGATCNTTTVDHPWAHTTVVYRWDEGVPVRPQKTAKQKLREILKSRHAPAVISRAKPVGHATDEREMRARETLRRVVGDDKYQNFLRTGWVSVKAKSGLVYQIFPGHGITAVYDRGKMIDRLCVVLNGNFPPTDSLIIRYLLILNNEKMFRSKAIVHQPTNHKVQPQADQRSLIAIAEEIRGLKLAIAG